MSKYRRPTQLGATYFLTVVTLKRRPFLCTPKLRRVLREAILETQEKYPFIIDVWVLLPDHMHCLWTLPKGDRELGKRWAMIKRLVTQQCPELKRLDWLTPSRKSRNESTLWQRRFWEHLIRDDIDFKNHLEYIHYNPVKHGLCEKSIDWPYSTVHRWKRLAEE